MTSIRSWLAPADCVLPPAEPVRCFRPARGRHGGHEIQPRSSPRSLCPQLTLSGAYESWPERAETSQPERPEARVKRFVVRWIAGTMLALGATAGPLVAQVGTL